jgi:flagellar biosynthesis protein FlhF
MVDTDGFVDNFRVLITKLDETKYRGSILNIRKKKKKPLAYVTTGQDVPDDIEIADIESLVKQIVRE